MKYRLADGPQGREKYEGRLEIEFEGKWGTVCNDGFDKKAAEVVCRSLGQK